MTNKSGNELINYEQIIPNFDYSENCIGLRNLGNTCYLNCVIQSIFGVKFLSTKLFESIDQVIKDQPLIASLFKLYKAYQNSQNEIKSYKTITSYDQIVNCLIEFKKRISEIDLKFSKDEQQDAAELMQIIIDSINNELKALNNSNPINFLKTTIEQTSKCLECKSTEYSNIDFTNFTLYFPVKFLNETDINFHLQSLLNNLLLKKQFDNIDCKCQGLKNTKEYQYSIKNLPDVLILNLARFMKNNDGTLEKKLGKIKVPLSIIFPSIFIEEYV